VAYVREQQIRKGDKTYRYYQLVRGYRENGKVKIEVLKHLGRYDSIEDARRAAESVVTKEGVPEYIKRLEELQREYDGWAAAHLEKREEFAKSGQSWNRMVGEYQDLAGKKTKAAHARRRALRRVLNKVEGPRSKAWDVRDKAMELYDSLTAEELLVVKEHGIPMIRKALEDREFSDYFWSLGHR
jgi:hypothetical protein